MRDKLTAARSQIANTIAIAPVLREYATRMFIALRVLNCSLSVCQKNVWNITTVWIPFCCAASGMTWLRRRGHHRMLQLTCCWCSMARRSSLMDRVSAMSCRRRTMTMLASLKTLTWKLMVPSSNLHFFSMGDYLRFLYSSYGHSWKLVVSQELIQNFK
jgi:hypothetical protein